MNLPFDDRDPSLDRLLQQTFRDRPHGTGAQPSLADVRHRARRSQRRRAGSMLGAAAVVGVGGVAVLANRTPGATSAGDEASTTLAAALPTTSMCVTGTVPYAVSTTTWPNVPTTWPYAPTTWLGPDLSLPEGTWSEYTSTTDAMFDDTGCSQAPPAWRCLGGTGADDQYAYFEYCEPVDPYPYGTVTTIEYYPFPAPTTTVTGQDQTPLGTTTLPPTTTTTDLTATSTSTPGGG